MQRKETKCPAIDPSLKQALQELYRHAEVLQEMIAEVLRLAKESGR